MHLFQAFSAGDESTIPATSVLWPRNGTKSSQFSRRPGALLKMTGSPSGLQMPALFNTFRPLSYGASHHSMAANQARACPRLPVLTGATWPCAWLLPCTGPAPRCCPFDDKDKLGATGAAGTLPHRAPPASSKSSTAWSGAAAAATQHPRTRLGGASMPHSVPRTCKHKVQRQPDCCLHLVR